MTPDRIIAEILGITYDEKMYQDLIYQSIIDMLVGSHKSKINWEEYRLKVEPMLLNKWEEILSKCRAHGFSAPVVAYDNKQRCLLWQQIILTKSLGQRMFPQEQVERI